MQISLKNYTLRYLSLAFFLIISVWAALFYAYILDEVYDNVDDGLKNQKIEILRELYKFPELLETSEFGISQFRILPVKDMDDFSEENKLSSVFFYMPYDDEQEPYRVLSTGFYAANKKPYHLEIRTSTVEEDDLIYDLTTALIVLYIVLVLGMYLINEVVLRKAWKPFTTILANLNHYRFGQKASLKSIRTNVVEFNKLDEEIRRMWNRNEEVFEEQKRFIENAAHELQTPLAITINKLELLMEDETLSEAQLTQIEESKSSLRRMVNLNKALLMMSRIENKQYAHVEPVNFNLLTNQLIEDLTDLFAFKEIELERLEQGVFVAEMNPDLAHILVSNLLRNAVRHNNITGKISVSFQPQQLVIANTGPKEALDAERLFLRFYKGAQEGQSNGLGLAIVKSIIDSSPNIQLEYVYSAGQHIFIVKHA
ncbi:sensor histidine kinase [Sphingobacterium bambusae]|uniref:histidine kinase n=1 Tax=Sphingobacterium bambusae TaxID=662858 RepID=A0ABW6BJQ4_9SPHI|nr:HAMP domain-containing sensor histidine kinase [Sphingobacterium bambusae]WPL47714.1 HAMP domain-containing sensor histidine kinase [Sphingobacterium bambusae]